MLNKWMNLVAATLFSLGVIYCAVAQTSQSTAENTSHMSRAMPFSNYAKLLDKEGILVYGNKESFFTPYTGDKLPPEAIEGTERIRFGILQLTPSLKVYLDYIQNPMGGSYEFINVENNKPIGELLDDFRNIEALYINGAGNIYIYTIPSGLCWGRATYKYEVNADKLVEVPQPLYYVNAESLITVPQVDLLLEPKNNAPKVASLTNQTKVNVIGVVQNISGDSMENWFLVSSPLGLTGWAKSYHDGESFFDIIQCN